MTSDEQAEPYARVADEARMRVREGDPDAYHRWLYSAMRAVATARGRPDSMPTVTDWIALATVLAVAASAEDEWAVLTEWLHRPQLRPHGTMAALRRHQAHKERPCSWCRAWEAGYKAGRYARMREAAA